MMRMKQWTKNDPSPLHSIASFELPRQRAMLDTADASALRQHQRSQPSPTLEGKADQNAAAIACRSLNNRCTCTVHFIIRGWGLTCTSHIIWDQNAHVKSSSSAFSSASIFSATSSSNLFSMISTCCDSWLILVKMRLVSYMIVAT